MIGKTRSIRGVIQFVVLSLVTFRGILHQTIGGGPSGSASIHALCPFGGIESFYSLVTAGEFIKKTFYSNIILIAGSTLLVLILGRIFCGWICALGTLQDIFGGIGKKIIKKRYQIPKRIDSFLRYLKYLVLIGVIYLTWKTGTLILNDYDPFAAYSHITAGWEELLGEYIIGFGILVAMLTASLFYDRLFCRYLCPLGAYYAILGKFSVFKIKRIESTCIHCDKCDKGCPAGLNISDSNQVKNSECLGCMECVSLCPTPKNSLEVNTMSRNISGKKAGILGVGIFFGIILITKSIGLYEEAPNNLQDILKGNPNNIRGWMSIQNLSDEFDIPLKDIYSEIGLTPVELSPEIPIKESEVILEEKGIEFDHDSIGEAVSLLIAIPLEEKEEHSELLGTETTDFELKGSMTIEEISARSGLTAREVTKKLKLSEGASHNLPLKTLSSEYGFQMEEVKIRWSK